MAFKQYADVSFSYWKRGKLRVRSDLIKCQMKRWWTVQNSWSIIFLSTWIVTVFSVINILSGNSCLCVATHLFWVILNDMSNSIYFSKLSFIVFDWYLFLSQNEYIFLVDEFSLTLNLLRRWIWIFNFVW